MNSVRLCVRDALGNEYLTTFTANTPENVKKFRKHAKACERHWKSAAYRKGVHPSRWPVFPITVHVEPYEDKSQ